ncbi:MAG: rhodanese-like domain-containing protein [Pseudomonadota bacterium]
MIATSTRLDEVTPDEAYRLLREEDSVRLVDVRTRAEWSFVGLPDLVDASKRVWPVEWVVFPTMAPNPHFMTQLTECAAADGGMPRQLLFICRSGQRSMAAAHAVAAWIADGGFRDDGAPVRLSNVLEGFEGDLDGDAHRGRQNGWKARGLPWSQS